MNLPAQLYRYNDQEMTLVKEKEKFFADSFDPNHEMEYTEWLNLRKNSSFKFVTD
jgi:hypothetical protein